MGSHNGKIFLFSGKQNPTIWENMGISWTRFRSKFARFWEILGKCKKMWGYFGNIVDKISEQVCPFLGNIGKMQENVGLFWEYRGQDFGASLPVFGKYWENARKCGVILGKYG